MRPVLFQIGDYTFYSFGLMAALALIVPGLVLVRPLLRRRGVPADFAYELIVAAGVGGFAGARLYYLAENWSATAADFWGMLFGSIGFTWSTLCFRMPPVVLCNSATLCPPYRNPPQEK